jgi:aminoglycoside phosphotransferase (APT) family kinase protein
MPVPLRRDPQTMAAALSVWFREKLDEPAHLAITGCSIPSTSGFSNETLILDLEWAARGGPQRSESLVVRLQPDRHNVFLASNLETQYRLLDVLGRMSDVKVPPVVWFEPGEETLGAPFLVMRKVAGVPVSDDPPYNAGGWLFELRPEARARVWRNAVDGLVSVHRALSPGVSVLVPEGLSGCAFDDVVDYWRRSLLWAARGRSQPVAEAAWEWIEDNLPHGRPDGLSWGDARMGNILFVDGEVRAILDWEMASLGGHLLDLGWWLFLDEFHSLHAPRLDGLGTRADTIEAWETGTGEKAADLDWYEIFAGLRFSTVMMRLAQIFEASGVDTGDMERNNAVTHVLARKLGLAPPGVLPKR